MKSQIASPVHCVRVGVANCIYGREQRLPSNYTDTTPSTYLKYFPNQKNKKMQTLILNDCERLAQVFTQASSTIRDEGVSKYPIFVAHQQEVMAVGLALVNGATMGCEFSYQATTLEELVAKRIVQFEQLEEFRKIYKNPSKFWCFMTIEIDEEDGDETPQTKFSFVPYN
jgi:dsDNA-binding SOS-regulon protein